MKQTSIHLRVFGGFYMGTGKNFPKKNFKKFGILALL